MERSPPQQQIPMFEIKICNDDDDSGELEAKKNMLAVFNRLFPSTKASKDVLPLPLPLSPGDRRSESPLGELPPVIDLHVIDLKPAVSGCNIRWAKAPPMDISQLPLADTLSTAEQECCSILRLLPKQYLVVKHTLIQAGKQYPPGSFKKRDAQKLCRIDVNKTSKVFEWFVKLNWIPNTLCRNLNKIYQQ
ncbi:hypothetical protein FB645_005804 [Coemansia sp. IMI 203386]|nr:hypothetical protein FB645_005804 [Coemansia sp. IMI 203386]